MSRIRLDSSSRMPLDSAMSARAHEDSSDELLATLQELGESIAQKPRRYVELTARSHFSFLAGGSSPQQLVQRAKKLGYDRIAITDRDGLYGAVRAWEEAKKLNITLLIGVELTIEDGSSVTVIVQNHAGYTNLCQVLTTSHGRHKKGEAGLPLLELCLHAKGLQALLHEPYVGVKALRDAFGACLSLAVHIHRDGGDRNRLALASEASRTYLVPICATGQVRYAEKNDKPLYDVVSCMQHKTTLDEAGRLLSPNAEAYLHSEEEMLKIFAANPAWVDRTRIIAESCTFCFSELKYRFPSDDGSGIEPNLRLRELSYAGAQVRYPEGLPESVRVQVEKELAIIAQLDVAPYFLSVREIVELAKVRDILCQGRGSAANSAVCYCLGITAVDPARSNLLFERFISIERREPPDIDIDFEHERREEVIQDIYAKYGRDKAAMVSEVVCFRGKSSVREVGKVFGLSVDEVSRLASLCSYWDTTDAITDARLTELGFDARDARLRMVLDIARRLQGCPRHLSVHVGGFVISEAALTDVTPIEPATMADRTVIPWDKDDIDALGFFKIDVLGLGMLTALRKALDLIGDPKGEGQSCSAIERLARVPSEDPLVYRALSNADTVGVFQIESRAQMAMLPRLRPEKFYDLVVEVAIVRPGPIQGGMVHPYLRRRNGEEAIDSPHPILTPILERTLGVPLFQEQVMQIAIIGAGYTGGDADQLRRDMAAWRRNGKLERHKEKLTRGFLERGISEEFAERLYKQIQGFGEYGFPESHAASFALLVYASAWLKVHHPAAFATALLNSQPMGFYSASTICQDAARHGVKVLPVAVDVSQWDCTLEPLSEPLGEPLEESSTAELVTQKLATSKAGSALAIRLGLRQVVGLGDEAGKRIVAARNAQSFTTMEDLAARANLHKDHLSALAEADALRVLMNQGARPALRASEDLRREAMWKVHAPEGRNLFEGHVLDGAVPVFARMTAEQQLTLDYERTGLSVESHPLKLLRPKLSKKVKTARELLGCRKGEKVQVAGMVICRQRPMTASGVVFMTLEDETGFLNLVLWTRVFEALRVVANSSSLLLCEGTLDRAELPPEVEAHGTLHVIVRNLKALSLTHDPRPTSVTSLRVASTSNLELPSMSRDFH